MQIKDDSGQIHEFPEGTSLSEMNEALGMAPKESMPQESHWWNSPEAKFGTGQEDAGRTPSDTAQDIGVGLMRGGQHTAAALGKVGQGLASALTGGYAPRADIGEELGLGQDRPIDFQNLIGSEHPNEYIQEGAQYAPALATGKLPLGRAGAALSRSGNIGKFIANLLSKGTPQAAYAGSQTENPATGIAMGYGGQALGEAAPLLWKGGKSAIDYLRPEKDAAAYLESLGKGTEAENIKALSEKIQSVRQGEEAAALEPKEKLFETEAKSKIFPSQERKDKLIKDIFKGLRIRGADEADQKAVSRSINQYYKNGDFEGLVESLQENLGIDELPHNKIVALEQSLEMEPLKNGKYLNQENLTKGYDEGMQEKHHAFNNHPTLENADALKQVIGNEKRRLESLHARTGRDAYRIRAKRLARNENALLGDMEEFFQTLPPEKQNLYAEFRQKWASEIPKYEKAHKVIDKLSKGETKGLTQAKVATAFRGVPSEEKARILEKIGEPGKTNIKKNLFLGESPEKLADAIMKARYGGGYEHIVTGSDEAFAKELLKRAKHRGYANKIGIGAGLLGTEEFIRHNF